MFQLISLNFSLMCMRLFRGVCTFCNSIGHSADLLHKTAQALLTVQTQCSMAV